MNFTSRKLLGFTLIELLVVISIIGILASVVLSSMSEAKKNANDVARMQEAHQLAIALEMYRNAKGVYPCPTFAGCNDETVAVQVISTAPSTYFKTEMSPYFTASAFVGPVIWMDQATGNSSSMRYRAGTNSSGVVDRNSYTIIVRQESTNLFNGWCSIHMGSGNRYVDGINNFVGDSLAYPKCF